ncbi:MAG: TRAP transporter small permease [Acidiferrobacterales bacterium]
MPPAKLGGLLRVVAAVEDGLLAALLAVMIAIASAQIFLRDVFDSGFVSGDHILRVLVLWITLLGAMAASRDDRHMSVDVLSRFLPARVRLASRLIVDIFAVMVCALVAFHAARFVMSDRAAGIPAFGSVPAWLVELILPIGFATMALRYLLLVFARVGKLRSGSHDT